MSRLGAILEAYAVGDALGMPTEFMTREEIKRRFGALVSGLIDPKEGRNHQNLPFASVTDDTEQVLYLLARYRASARVDMRETADTLETWIKETRADEKGYIGPSSKRALQSIKEGVPPQKAGEIGLTCGGVMRAPAAVLYKRREDEKGLFDDLYACVAPTHNTSAALEAAGAYGAALLAAKQGQPVQGVMAAAYRGAGLLKAYAPYAWCAPSCEARLRFGETLAAKCTEEVLDTLYFLLGTGLPSADVCGAVFTIFCHARKDVWLALKMGASVGGDTDTIAALAGALCAAHAGGHNIPAQALEAVYRANATLFIEKEC